MRRKNKRVEQEDTHRWMVSYADFITLLFAFFVVMYAISSVNVSKYKSLAEGMHTAFTKKTNEKGITNIASKEASRTAVDNQINQQDQFNELIKALSDLQDSDYQMNPQNGWVELDIKAGALFDSGSAELRPIAMIKLMKIAEILKKLPYPIALEGYTDNVPIDTPQFPSNWELSSARAAAVARSLTTFGVDSTKISVTGFGEQYPVADNHTEEGRAKNRRVNMVIAKDKTVPRLLNPEATVRDESGVPVNMDESANTAVNTNNNQEKQ